jgi:hypothetical protein
VSETTGPGKTRYVANKDGGISKCLWGDPAWTTHLVDAHNPLPARKVASLLQEAYAAGLADQQTIVRRSLGILEPRR